MVSHEARVSVGLVVVWIAALWYGVGSIRDEYERVGGGASQRAAPHRSFPQVTGVDYQQFDKQGLFAELRADSLLIAPRDFLAFNFNSVNELRLVNAHLEIHLHGDGPQDFDLGALATSLLAQGKAVSAQNGPRAIFGVIARGVAKPVTVTLFKEGSPSIYLTAERAYIGRRKEARFLRASLEDAARHRRITSGEIVWNAKSEAFLVPGDYVVETDSGHANGRGVRVDLNFVATPLPR
jgi:hypothetical protein